MATPQYILKKINDAKTHNVSYLDLSWGREVFQLHCHLDKITGLASTEGYLISSSRDRTVRFWNLTDNNRQIRILEHATSVTCMALSADKKIIAAGEKSGKITIWDVETGNEVKTFNTDTDKSLNCLAFYKNFVIVGTEDIPKSNWNSDLLLNSKVYLIIAA